MTELHAAQDPDALLRTVYSSERQRAHVIRCLSWVIGTGRNPDLEWWKIPAQISRRQIRLARCLSLCTVLAADAAATIAVASATVWYLFLLLSTLILIVGAKQTLMRRRWLPLAIVPRRPSWGKLVELSLLAAVTAGMALLPVLLAMWRVRATDRNAAASYRADRLSSVLYGLAYAPIGAVLGLLAYTVGNGSTGRLGVILASALTLSAGAWLCRGSSYSRLKLTELTLAVKWRGRVGFHRVLEDAVRKQVLVHTSTGYAFSNGGSLAAFGEAAQPAMARRRTAHARRNSIRAKRSRPAWVAWLLRKALTQPPTDLTPRNRLLSAFVARLSAPRIGRISFDFGVGTAVAVFAAYLISAIPAGKAIESLVECSIFFPLLGLFVGMVVSMVMLTGARRVARGGAVWLPLLSRAAIVSGALAAVCAGTVLVAVAGTFLAHALAFLLPSAFVSACGLWLCVIAFRAWHLSPRRWLRRVPDQVAVAASSAALLVAADRELLTTQWASVLLFPIAVTGSVRVWKRMRKDRRLIIKAGADIALSLLLGAELVLFLVWLANIIGMPAAEVAVIRKELGEAGSLAGIYDGGLRWAGIYGALAMASAVVALQPARLKKLGTWLHRLPRWAPVPQRMLTGAYVGILTIVFVGAAGPRALTPTLQHQLKATYAVELQRQFEQDAEATAYDEIREEINKLVPSSAVSALVYLVQAIHNDTHRPAGSHEASAAEEPLAYRLGQDQAATLAMTDPPSPAGQEAAATSAFDEPVQDAGQLSNLATETATAKTDSDQARAHLETASELAISAVVNAIPIPGVSRNEVAQIFTQYITGLVDSSKVRETFEAWREHVPRSKRPPSAEALIIPDPNQMGQFTQSDLDSAAAAQGIVVLPDDPAGVPDSSLSAAEVEQSAINTAVDTAAQAQQVQETGTCTGCTVIGNGDNPAVNGNDQNPSHDQQDNEPAPEVHAGE